MVGGGLLGLWTALEVREQAPDASVVLIEGEACGFGASGRNGGWMTSWWDELDALEARFGADDARWLAARSSEAIDRVARVTEAEGIDCGLRRGGALIAATAPAQLTRLPAGDRGPRAAGRRRRSCGGAPARPSASRASSSPTRRPCIRRGWCAGCAASPCAAACGSSRARRCVRSSAAARRA